MNVSMNDNCSVNGSEIRPQVEMTVAGQKDRVVVMIDTGASCSLMRESLYLRWFPHVCLGMQKAVLQTLTGSPIETKGEGDFRVDGLMMRMTIVADMPVHMLIGTDMLIRHGGQIDYTTQKLILNGRTYPFIGSGRSPGVATVMTDRQINHLVEDYSEVFSQADGCLEGAIGLKPFEIETEGAPIYTRPYRAALTKRHFIDESIDEMLRNGIIEPSQSPWASPVTLAPKKGGWRFCVDYRAVNAVTKKDRFPLPHIQDIFDTVGKGRVFTTLDLKSGYWQLPVREEDREKTAFICHRGLFHYRRVSFGLANAPAYFQRAMSHVLAPLLGKCALVYIDDIIIYSKDMESHVRDLKSVFELLKGYNLQLKRSKCTFAQPGVDLLGYHINGRGIAPLVTKTSAIRDLPSPKTVSNVRSFLGMSGYYRQCVPNYAHIAEPLVSLTRRNTPWTWGRRQQEAFDTLKTLLVSSDVMVHPDVDKPYRLHTDSSDYALGAILCQVDDQGVERVVQYLSHQLNPIQRKWATVEKEAYAVVYALQKLRPYLLGAEFTVYTDHKPLKSLFTKQMDNTKIQRWAVLLAEYGAKIEYRKGCDNVRADMLSRITSSSVTEPLPIAMVLRSMKTPSDKTLTDKGAGVRYGLKGAEVKAAQLLEYESEIEQALYNEDSTYSYEDGLLRSEDIPYRGAEYRDRIVLPKQYRDKVIKMAHESSGHSGPTKTLKRIWEDFSWKGVRGDVRKYINKCGVCQVYKRGLDRTGMTEIDIPRTPMQMVGIDFIGPFVQDPMGCKYVLTVIDYLSGWAEAYRTEGTTSGEVIDTLAQEFIPRHGVPRILVSDNGPCFTSREWEEFVNGAGIEHRRTTPYHPQGNSRIERFNGTIKRLISKACRNKPRDWYLHVNSALAAYRTSVHEATGYTPFFMLYGRRSGIPLERFLGAQGGAFGNRLDDLAQAYREARINQQGARASNKRRLDARANVNDSLKVGDTVVVKVEAGITHTSQWDPQYEVIRVEGTTHWIRHQVSGKERRVHREKLRLVDPDIGWDEVQDRPRRQTQT